MDHLWLPRAVHGLRPVRRGNPAGNQPARCASRGRRRGSPRGLLADVSRVVGIGGGRVLAGDPSRAVPRRTTRHRVRPGDPVRPGFVETIDARWKPGAPGAVSGAAGPVRVDAARPGCRRDAGPGWACGEYRGGTLT